MENWLDNKISILDSNLAKPIRRLIHKRYYSEGYFNNEILQAKYIECSEKLI